MLTDFLEKASSKKARQSIRSRELQRVAKQWPHRASGG
jgi:hypothetical protein